MTGFEKYVKAAAEQAVLKFVQDGGWDAVVNRLAEALALSLEESLFAPGGDANKSLQPRVLSIVSGPNGETGGVIKNKLRPAPPERVAALLKQMVESGLLDAVDSIHPGNGKTIRRYFKRDALIDREKGEQGDER